MTEAQTLEMVRLVVMARRLNAKAAQIEGDPDLVAFAAVYRLVAREMAQLVETAVRNMK